MIKTKTGIRFFFIGLISAALACSTFFGSASSNKNSDSPASGALPEKTYLGDFITYKGYFFAVLQVQDPVPPSANAISRPGNRDVALEVVLGNHDGDGSSPISTSFGGLGEDSSHVFGQDPMKSGAGIGVDLAGFFDRGESVRGWMVFSLPDSVQPLALKLSVINPAGGWIPFSYGLTPPPAGYTPLRADTSHPSFSHAAFGKAAEKDGASLKAMQVKDNLNSIPSIFFTLPSNARVVGVQIEIRGTKDRGLRIVDLSLADTNGYIYRMKGSEIIQSQGKLFLGPNEVLQDWVYFVLPADAKFDVIRLICASDSNPGENIFLRSALS